MGCMLQGVLLLCFCRKAQCEHQSSLTRQLLQSRGVSLKWHDVIMLLANRICQKVKPDIRGARESSDIRQYIQIKKVTVKKQTLLTLKRLSFDLAVFSKVTGETRTHPQIVSGVVCTKNVAHKKMRRTVNNPNILLLSASIEYQRVENKFSSLEPQILQVCPIIAQEGGCIIVQFKI